MKLNAALAKTLLMAASIGMVVPIAAQTTARPAKPNAANAKAGIEEEEEGKIEGLAIARPDGRWLGLTMDGLRFKLTFYDQKKKPEPVDAVRATARWRPPTRNQEFIVLNPGGDGTALFSTRPIDKPWNFRIYFTLIGADDQVLESHVVDYKE